MTRKIFGWILLILGLLCVASIFLMKGNLTTTIPYSLFWIYVFIISGYRLIKTPSTRELIPLWVKFLVYLLTLLICAIIGSVFVFYDPILIGWVTVVLFVFLVEGNVVRKIMLLVCRKKQRAKQNKLRLQEKTSTITTQPPIPQRETDKKLNISTIIHAPFQKKVNIALLILTSVTLIISIVLVIAVLSGEDEFIPGWLISTLIAAIARVIWYCLNQNHLTQKQTKNYGLAFLISGFVLFLSPFYALSTLFVGTVLTKRIYDSN